MLIFCCLELTFAFGSCRVEQDGIGVLRLHHALHGGPGTPQEPNGSRLRQHNIGNH